MKKIDVVTVVKVVGMGLTLAGTLASNWTNKKETDNLMEKLIDEKLKTKMGES